MSPLGGLLPLVLKLIPLALSPSGPPLPRALPALRGAVNHCADAPGWVFFQLPPSAVAALAGSEPALDTRDATQPRADGPPALCQARRRCVYSVGGSAAG